MESARQYLLNLASGGDGHASPWIEQPGPDLFIVHLPPRYPKEKEIQIQMSSGEAASGLIKALETGAQPAPRRMNNP